MVTNINNTQHIYTIYKRIAKQNFIGGYQGESFKHSNNSNNVVFIIYVVKIIVDTPINANCTQNNEFFDQSPQATEFLVFIVAL